MLSPEVEMLRIGEIIDASLKKDARFFDFERIATLRWVSGPAHNMRKLFEFQAMKGNQYSARWGWSVEFVPVLKGRKLAWKRAASKADFDLCIAPIDQLGSLPGWCSFTRSEEMIPRMSQIAQESFKAAIADLNDVVTLDDLASLFQRRSKMRFQRFSLENYVQTDLAWGLVLISIGQEQAGYELLDRFCNRFNLERHLAVLGKAEAEAKLTWSQKS